jgi:hypothetical protein
MKVNASQAILNSASSLSDVGSDGPKKRAMVELARRVRPDAEMTKDLLSDVIQRVFIRYDSEPPWTIDSCISWAAYINSCS